MYAVINGKRVAVADGETVGELRRRTGQHQEREQALRVGKGGKAERVKDEEPVQAGDRLVTVPPIVKGVVAARPRLAPRLESELALLRDSLGTQCRVEAGRLEEDDRAWTGVLVHNVRLNEAKFGVTHSKLLFLLPADYPATPPLGCYLFYRHPSRDHHFTLRSHYGAPSLEDRGWYWYCVGLGGGFDAASQRRLWKPGRRAEEGHSLLTLLASATWAMNQGD